MRRVASPALPPCSVRPTLSSAVRRWGSQKKSVAVGLLTVKASGMRKDRQVKGKNLVKACKKLIIINY